MDVIDIAEVARRTGLPASTLRHYEAQGLIASVGRRGLRRLFASRVLEDLALVRLARAAGFQLAEIAAMLAGGGGRRVDRRRLLAKADEIDRSIARLAAVRDGLRHAARCPAPSHMQCDKFRRLMALAGAGRLDRPQPRRTRSRARPGAGGG
ncbi:MAG: MerR family transcriptional regulator [Hyphomicrobiaceae bacterium]|nr:MerR family transcriptional regulator [Hyphomicrobiaceae bacterium]